MEKFKIPSHFFFLFGDHNTDPAPLKETSVRSLVIDRSAERCCLCNFSWNQTDRFRWVGGGDSGTRAVKTTHQQRYWKKPQRATRGRILALRGSDYNMLVSFSASQTSVPSDLKTRSIISSSCCSFSHSVHRNCASVPQQVSITINRLTNVTFGKRRYKPTAVVNKPPVKQTLLSKQKISAPSILFLKKRLSEGVRAVSQSFSTLEANVNKRWNKSHRHSWNSHCAEKWDLVWHFGSVWGFRQLPSSVWILTFRLLRRQNQDRDLDGVRLSDAVRDRQLELVHPRRQIWHDDLVLKVCFLQSGGTKVTTKDENLFIALNGACGGQVWACASPRCGRTGTRWASATGRTRSLCRPCSACRSASPCPGAGRPRPGLRWPQADGLSHLERKRDEWLGKPESTTRWRVRTSRNGGFCPLKT